MDPYVGEIRLFAGPYVPEDWLACNGQPLAINSYQALYALIGTIYGGSGANFNLPNLQVALAVGQSPTPPPTMASPYPLGQAGGAYNVTLTEANLPPHTHPMNATTAAGTTTIPSATVTLAAPASGFTSYVTPGTPPPPLVNLMPAAVSAAGGGQAHPNMMPTLVINYIICTNGIYPTFN